MRVIMNSQILAAELRLLNKVVPTNPVIPILSCALLRADERVYLSATDLEVGLSTSCDARVEAPGYVALPVEKLLALVEQFPDADVSLALDGSRVTVSCGAFQSRLQTMPAADFPLVPQPDGHVERFDAGVFKSMLDRVRHAASSTQVRHILRGVLLTLTGKAAAVVATDGKRLALATMGRESDGGDVSVIIPSKAIDALRGQLESGSSVEVTIGSGHLFFTTRGGRVLTSRTIDGVFPAYQRIIPQDNDRVIVVDRLVLTPALKRVRVFADKNCAVHMSISPGSLGLSSGGMEIGSASETVAAEYEGAPMRICLNCDYVLDFLGAAVRQTVTVKVKDEEHPTLWMDGDDCISVIMVMGVR